MKLAVFSAAGLRVGLWLVLAEMIMWCVVGQGGSTESPPTSESQVALYTVVAIIAIFIVTIITLSIMIVLLYRRKCGHQDLAAPSGKRLVHVHAS